MKFAAITSALLLTIGLSGCTYDYTDALPDPTHSIPTADPDLLPDPAPTKEVSLEWPNGLKVVDVSDSTSRSCTYDMCQFLRLTAKKNCSSITIDGTTYTADDEEVDSFSVDYGRLKKGKTRIVEFGADASYDSEDYVDFDTVTCFR